MGSLSKASIPHPIFLHHPPCVFESRGCDGEPDGSNHGNPRRTLVEIASRDFSRQRGVRRGWVGARGVSYIMSSCYGRPTWLRHDISKSSPEIAPKKFDLTVILLLQGMGATQAGRRDHLETITLLSWLVVSLTTILLSLRCHARVRWDAGWARERGIFFISTHGVLQHHTQS